ncbi:TPA: hypothetical protein DEG21_01975, partial [Patescibacteria group bacterium]|nr:hypothetical protein [Candidatus Gracilibacteria bacterium]
TGLQLIKDVITEVEKRTAGEIKVAIVSASSIVPRLKKADKEKAVTRRAKSLFRKLGINKTKEATGVLILISLEERMVRIQPDKAIDNISPQINWESLILQIIVGIKFKRPVDAICNVIYQLGDHLAKHFPVKPDDINEISNDVVITGRW